MTQPQDRPRDKPQDRPRLALIGGGGHCRSCLDVIEAQGRYQVAAVLDLPERVGQEVLGHPITGTEADIPELARAGFEFLVTLGQIHKPQRRMEIFAAILAAGGRPATVISPLARVSPLARLGAGTIVMHFALVNAGAEVGRNCILNSHCLVEHDVRVGDHCHVSTGAILNGGAALGEGSFLGSRSVVREGLRLGRRVVVGMGAAVFQPLADGQWLRGDK
ncbi:MAG: acetyltransferase [Desulfovibrionaceae bacterium]